ncbi:unnamed protein product [Diamesa tonsa]
MTSTNLNWLVFKMYQIKNYDYCKQLIEQQMEENFNQEYLFYIKGLIMRAENDHNGALKSFQRAIDFNSKNPDIYKEIGKTLYVMNKYRQSLEIFLKAESLLERPDHEIYHFIGELLHMNAAAVNGKANVIEAKEYFKRAIMSGKQIKTYKLLSSIYRKEKDYPKAIELLESSLQVAPGNIEMFSDLGIMYLKVNEVDRAYEKLQEAIQIEKHTGCLLALGAIMQTKNDVDGALNHYKNIQNMQNESFEVWSNLGMCFYKKNKLIASISCLKKSLWLSPLNFNVLYNMGIVLMTAKQFASSFQCFVSAVSLRPDSAECYMLLAICLGNLNDHENALIAFRKSVLCSKDAIKNPLIYLNYSIFAFNVLNDTVEAQQYLNNYYNLCEQIKVPGEYMRIADSLLAMLPTTIPLPETTTTQRIIENRNLTTQWEKNDEESTEQHDIHEAKDSQNQLEDINEDLV